jgi:hypothetical protein
VLARAAAAGLDGDFAGHSLRAGFATAAARAGRSEAAIMCPRALEESVQIARHYIRQGAAGSSRALTTQAAFRWPLLVRVLGEPPRTSYLMKNGEPRWCALESRHECRSLI